MSKGFWAAVAVIPTILALLSFPVSGPWHPFTVGIVGFFGTIAAMCWSMCYVAGAHPPNEEDSQ